MRESLHILHSSCRHRVRRARHACLVLFMTLLIAALPARSYAQCEPPPAAMSAATSISTFQEMEVFSMMVPNLQLFETFYIDTIDRAPLGQQDQTDWTNMFQTLNNFATMWQNALKQMTKQLSSGIINETANLGFINDADNILDAEQDLQKERIKAKFNSQPTEQACRFDTDANYLAQGRAIGDALEKGFEWDFVSVANNESGSLAQYGAGELENERWNIYTKNFCDYRAEDCDSGCSQGGATTTCTQDPATQSGANGGQNVNRDIRVSQMLFHDQTLAVGDQTTLQAVQSMMFNVTGFKVPDPILPKAMGTSAGIQQMFDRREYMARMSAAGSLLYSIVGDRVEGQPPPQNQLKEPAQIRQMMGIAWATGNPSVREIRQSVIEQLWDPNFYKNLGDNPATVSEKELFLKAYGLTMLYDLISKQEKISTAYAIQTANVLEEHANRSNFSSEAPMGQ